MAANKPGRLGIVIVNWNSGDMLRCCLQSMTNTECLDRLSQVVIVDNDSHDASCANLPQIGVPVVVIRNDANRGFAAACNQGAAACQSDYLLFLNPDSELLANSIRAPLEYMDAPQNQDVGICGIQLLDGKGRVARSCSRLPAFPSLLSMAWRLQGLSRKLFPPHFMKEWDHAETRQVEQVIGAFFLVRTQLFQQLGGFDERFFVYFEEVDFCERTRQQGLKTMYLATGQALHIGAGCSSQVKGRSLFYSLRSRLLYAQKHLPGWKAALVASSTMIAEPAIRLTFAILKLKWKNVGQLAYAYGMLWRDRFAPKPTRSNAVAQHTLHSTGNKAA